LYKGCEVIAEIGNCDNPNCTGSSSETNFDPGGLLKIEPFVAPVFEDLLTKQSSGCDFEASAGKLLGFCIN
jgi:hypothetical protein